MADKSKTDSHYMRLALAQARKGVGRTAPNPPVGAVVVKRGKVVGKGYHRRAGAPHAEIEALQSMSGSPRGAEMYVTLEPCDHQGKTPPCTRALIKAGIRRVVVGTLDPNPVVSGRGIARLEAAGIEVRVGVLEHECRRLIQGFEHWVLHGTPLVTLKAAVTLDGYLATRTGHSRWVTGEEARRLVMRMRDQCDAVMVGVGTVKADDPLLTARVRGGRDPVRVVLDSRLTSPDSARVLDPSTGGRTVVYTTRAAGRERTRAFEAKGVEVVRVRARRGRVDLEAVMDDLGRRGVHNLLVEGGGQVFGSLLSRMLAHRAAVFVAPKILTGDEGIKLAGGTIGPRLMGSAVEVSGHEVKRLGKDLLVHGDLVYPELGRS